MKTFGVDKVWHFVGSAALVLAAYLFQMFFGRPKRPAEDYRLLLAAGFSLSVGIVKEVMDATNVFPWCDGDCKFDGWDLLVDLNGVTAAVLYIIAGRNLCCSYQEQPQDDLTVASTVAPLEEEKENENTGNEQGQEQWKASTNNDANGDGGYAENCGTNAESTIIPIETL